MSRAPKPSSKAKFCRAILTTQKMSFPDREKCHTTSRTTFFLNSIRLTHVSRNCCLLIGLMASTEPGTLPWVSAPNWSARLPEPLAWSLGSEPSQRKTSSPATDAAVPLRWCPKAIQKESVKFSMILCFRERCVPTSSPTSVTVPTLGTEIPNHRREEN